MPNLLYSLFSVHKVEEKGMRITFFNKKVRIYYKNSLLAEGTRDGKLYPLTFKISRILNQAEANLTNENMTNLWHSRLGHVCKENSLKLLENNKIEGIDITATNTRKSFNRKCEICIMGKLHQLPFGKNKEKRTRRPLELGRKRNCDLRTPTIWDSKCSV